MTLNEMLIQGDAFNLAIMAGLFVLWVVMLFRIGSGVAAKFAAEKPGQAKVPAAARKDNAVIAAITAAVNEYRKNN